jgi:hypothetical protein
MLIVSIPSLKGIDWGAALKSNIQQFVTYKKFIIDKSKNWLRVKGWKKFSKQMSSKTGRINDK